jgi:hypothetical protein
MSTPSFFLSCCPIYHPLPIHLQILHNITITLIQININLHLHLHLPLLSFLLNKTHMKTEFKFLIATKRIHKNDVTKCHNAQRSFKLATFADESSRPEPWFLSSTSSLIDRSHHPCSAHPGVLSFFIIDNSTI